MTNFLPRWGRVLLLLALPVLTQAQSVGIGTTAPDVSAALDIVSSSKGALLPRVADATTIATPATGLLVFQTGGAPGFYYNAGTPGAPSWQKLATAAGTSTGFILNQTAADQAASFRISGTGSTLGNFGVGTSAPQLGLDAANGSSSIGLRNNAAWDHMYWFHDGNTAFMRAGGADTGLALQVGASSAGTYGDASQAYRDVMRLLPNGNVGIGTSTPAQTLDVAGTTRTTNAIVTSALTGNGDNIGAVVGVGIRADGGLNLGQNTTGNSLYLGYLAGRFSTGTQNQFSGYQSGYSNTVGYENQFSGYQSGYSNFDGYTNQFSGYQSGYNNRSGSGNQFIGYQSGYSNTDGSGNQFIGYKSGYRNTTGSNNLFSGNSSGFYNTTGAQNHFSGAGSGFFNTTGSNNLFSGNSSGFYNTTGSNNTFLGYNSGPTYGSGNNLTNTMALGANATVTTNNTIRLGDANITTLNCQVALTTTSDARFKYDVRADVPGLTFISALRPVTYRFDQARLGQFERTGTLAARSAPDAAAPLHTGFLAQDVEAAAQALHFRFDGVHAPANARDHYGLGYAQFVVPLVQAVQELNAEVEALKAQNAALQQQNAALHQQQQTQTTRFDEQQTSLQTLQQQMARLLGETAPAQARK